MLSNQVTPNNHEFNKWQITDRVLRVFMIKSELVYRLPLSSHFLVLSDNFAYPGAKSGDFGVNAGRLMRPAGVTPGCDSINHPAAPWSLAHEWASAVAAATVHAPVGLHAAGAEHAAGEGTVEVLLAEAAGQQGQGRLLQGFGVGPP